MWVTSPAFSRARSHPLAFACVDCVGSSPPCPARWHDTHPCFRFPGVVYQTRASHPSGSSRWTVPRRGNSSGPGSYEPQKTFGSRPCPSRVGRCGAGVLDDSYVARRRINLVQSLVARGRGVSIGTAPKRGAMERMKRWLISHSSWFAQSLFELAVSSKIILCCQPPNALFTSKSVLSRKT